MWKLCQKKSLPSQKKIRGVLKLEFWWTRPDFANRIVLIISLVLFFDFKSSDLDLRLDYITYVKPKFFLMGIRCLKVHC
jgi:hypothetical protein